ncbi:uncharacterized protein [Asterias amurensis]|uniref:uncharacterized protein isoform X2 n=1 Tax=Asterias amurensis TaxID=7602 RepID=UPI003AB3BFED
MNSRNLLLNFGNFNRKMLVTKTAALRSALDRLVDTEPPLGTSEDGTDQSLLHGGAAGRVVTTSGPKKDTRGLPSSIQKPNDLQCIASNVASGHHVTTETLDLRLGGVHRQQESRPACNMNATLLPVIDDCGYTEGDQPPEGVTVHNGPLPLHHTLPRSKKTTKFNVSSRLPELHHSPLCPNEGGSAVQIDFLLTVEGQDLRLPPPRTQTGPRRFTEKSNNRVNIERDITDFGLLQNGDDITTLEKSLKTMLLCQSMGICIEITRHHEESGENDGVAHVMFHCHRCLKHWTDYGRPPRECKGKESRTRGPSFNISNRSHDILKKFSNLAPDEKLCFLEAIQARDPADVRSPPCQSPQVHVIRPLDESQESNTTQSGAAHGDNTVALDETRVVRRQLEGAVLTEAALDQGDAAGGTAENEGRAKIFGPPNTIHESKSSTTNEQTNSTDLSNTKTVTSVEDLPMTVAAKQGLTTQSCPSNREPTLRNTKCQVHDNKRKTEKVLGPMIPVDTVDLMSQSSPANDHSSSDIDAPEQTTSGPFLAGKYFSQEDDVKNIKVTTSDQVGTSAQENNPPVKEGPRPVRSDGETQHSVTKVTITRTGLHLSHSNNKTASTNSDKDHETASNESLNDNLKNDTPASPKPVTLEQNSSSQFPTGESQQTMTPRSHSKTDKHCAREEPLGSRHTLNRKSGLHRDGGASYMGVMSDDDRSGLNPGSSTENSALSKESHDKVTKDRTFSPSQKVVPIRNPAVRNVTGKPDTRPGTIEKHMFATPRASLTQTNAVGMVPMKSGETLDVYTVPKSKLEDHSGAKSKVSATNNQPVKPSQRRESVVPGGNTARQLPPLSGNQRQLPPLSVRDTEHKSKGSDKRRGLGVPKAEELVDRHTEQQLRLRTGEPLPTLSDTQQEKDRNFSESKAKQKSKDRSKPVKRPPAVTQERQDIADTSTEGTGQERKPNVQNSLSTLNRNVQEHKSEVGTNILPAIDQAIGLETEQENDTWGTQSPLKNLLNQFENFELSLSPPPASSLPCASSLPPASSIPPASSLPPVPKTDKSFRMTYSTLPKTFDWDTSRQPPALTRGTPSPQPHGLLNDFLEHQEDYPRHVGARLKGTSAVRRQSGDIYDRSARTPSRFSGRKTNLSVSTSSSKSSQVSAAESVWESVSGIWRKHTLELNKLERMVALNFLPLTSAFTFSLFQLPPQYMEQNRLLREQAVQIRTLKKPKKIVFKFAPKPKKTALIRRPAKLVK